MNIQTLARQVLNSMETNTRDNGDKYRFFKDGSPEWMKDLAREAHGDILPDDYRYEFIYESLQAIIEHEDDFDGARNSIESDIYTSDLTAWLGSRNDRYCYVDEAIEEFGKGESTINDIMAGQLVEKLEVFESVANFLGKILEENEIANSDRGVI